LPEHDRTITMTIIHVVLFKITTSPDESVAKKITSDFLSLKDNCIHPQAQKPYITKLSGGADNSPEGLQGGLTHGFVVEFASKEDRDYYVSKDPAHQAFVKTLNDKVTDSRVIDFEPGVY